MHKVFGLLLTIHIQVCYDNETPLGRYVLLPMSIKWLLTFKRGYSCNCFPTFNLSQIDLSLVK